MKIRNVGFYWLLLMAVLSMSWCRLSLAQDAEVDAKKAKPLSKKVLQTVEKIIPTIRNRWENEFLELSMPLIKSSNSERLKIIDQMCSDRGVATVSEWFAELVVDKALQGIDPFRATKSRQMARVLLFEIADDLEEFEQSLARHVVMQKPQEVPTDFQESEKLFWDIYVLHNEFDNSSKKLQFANALLKRHGKALKRQGGEALVQRFAEIESRLEEQYSDIDERATELRLQRFRVAYQMLTDKENEDNFELMLTSAMALEQDGQVLTAFFEDNDSISRESLQDINLPGEISGMLISGRKAGGEVTKKANLFRNGLHYWVRGRYGAGPLTDGLVKATNATSTVKAMELLWMPKLRDKPISSYHSEEETSPGYDRRHHYTWAAERRAARVVGGKTTSSSVSSSSLVDNDPTSREIDFCFGGTANVTVHSQTETNVTRTSSTTTLPYLQFAEADDTFPYRLVGSYEYGRSLDNLGELANSSTKEEIEVYDKLIGLNPEYSFYSGAASELGVGVKLDSLSTFDKEMFDVKYLRQSLAWMMALARSELGATISMYGESKDPFGTAVAIGGVGFGSEELLSILVDDLAAHLKAAQHDPGYQAAVDPKEKVDESSLGYFRRTQLINDLLAKVVSSGDPEIAALAKPYAETSNRYTESMAKKIVLATTRVTSTSGSTTRTVSETEQFQFNREDLLQCQRALESRFPPTPPTPPTAHQDH